MGVVDVAAVVDEAERRPARVDRVGRLECAVGRGEHDELRRRAVRRARRTVVVAGTGRYEAAHRKPQPPPRRWCHTRYLAGIRCLTRLGAVGALGEQNCGRIPRVGLRLPPGVNSRWPSA